MGHFPLLPGQIFQLGAKYCWGQQHCACFNSSVQCACFTSTARSMLARLVPQSELGKVYGLLAILDAALPFAGTSWNQSYKLNLT